MTTNFLAPYSFEIPSLFFSRNHEILVRVQRQIPSFPLFYLTWARTLDQDLVLGLSIKLMWIPINERSILHQKVFNISRWPWLALVSSHGLTKHQSEKSQSDDTQRSGLRRDKVKFALSWARIQLAWHPTPFYQHFGYKHLFMRFSSHGKRSKSFYSTGFNLWLYLVKTFLGQFPDHSNTNLWRLETSRSNGKVFWLGYVGWWGATDGESLGG